MASAVRLRSPRAPFPLKFRAPLHALRCRMDALGDASAPPQLIFNEARLGGRSFRLELSPQEVANGASNVAFESFRARRQKERIVLAPDGQQRWLFRTEIFLKLGIERDIARIVQKQIELNLVVPRPRQQR